MRKGKWSKQEDDLLKNHIENDGIGASWQKLADTIGLQRCGRSCRSRWLNYLRPGLKHGNFTTLEERIICEMYSRRGSCWSVIAARLPGRTDLAVKNYWNSTLSKKFAAAARNTSLLFPKATTKKHRTTCSTSSRTKTKKPNNLPLVIDSNGSTQPVRKVGQETAAEMPLDKTSSDHISDEENNLPMSPLPLGFLDMELPDIACLDDIDSFLTWFDE